MIKETYSIYQDEYSDFSAAALIGPVADLLNTGIGKIGQGKEQRSEQYMQAMAAISGGLQSKNQLAESKNKQRTLLIIGALFTAGLVMTAIIFLLTRK